MKKEFKVFALFMILVIVMNFNISFDTSYNGHLLQFGEEANAVSQYYYSKYAINGTYILRFDGSTSGSRAGNSPLVYVSSLLIR